MRQSDPFYRPCRNQVAREFPSLDRSLESNDFSFPSTCDLRQDDSRRYFIRHFPFCRRPLPPLPPPPSPLSLSLSLSIATLVVLDLPQKCSSHASPCRGEQSSPLPSALFLSHPGPPLLLSRSSLLPSCLSVYLFLPFFSLQCRPLPPLFLNSFASLASAAVLLATTFFSVFTVQFLVPILPSFIVALFKLLMPWRQSSLLLSANE